MEATLTQEIEVTLTDYLVRGIADEDLEFRTAALLKYWPADATAMLPEVAAVLYDNWDERAEDAELEARTLALLTRIAA